MRKPGIMLPYSCKIPAKSIQTERRCSFCIAALLSHKRGDGTDQAFIAGGKPVFALSSEVCLFIHKQHFFALSAMPTVFAYNEKRAAHSAALFLGFVQEMLLSLILTYCIIIVQNEGGNNTMRIKRLAATLLLTATVFSIAAGSTTAMAASATDLYDDILANNKEFIEFHDGETIGLPLEISEEARELSNEID